MKSQEVLGTGGRLRTFLLPKLVIIDVYARDRDDVLDVIADELQRACSLDADAVRRALWRREQAGSTSIGGGFAIPHAQVPGVEAPLTVYLRTRRPIPFGARDGDPVQEFLAILVPADGHRDDHLQLLALVARLFSDPQFREQLRDAKDAQVARTVFQAGVDGLQGGD